MKGTASRLIETPLASKASISLPSPSLATTGQVEPGPAIGGIALTFICICLWLFLSSLKRPGDTPITRTVAAIGDAVHWARELFAHEPAGATS